MTRWFKHKLNELEQFSVDVIYGRRDDRAALAWSIFLHVLSWGWNFGAQLKVWLYEQRILRDQPLGCLVVVVGNLTWGGTGKTPVVEKFGRALSERGRRVAILSRGYRSRPNPLWKRALRWLYSRKEPPPKIVSDGHRVLLDSEHAGDEPYMLARNLPGVVVLVDKNRVKSGAYAIRRFGCDTLLLDDGFQYMPLKGRLNLLLVDKTNPFGNGQLIPRGILREPIKHLRRASYVFMTKSDGQRDRELEETIRAHNPTAEIIECAHVPKYLQRVNDGNERHELSHLKGRRVGAFSGIATPDSFEAFLRKFGANILYTKRFVDHYRFNSDDLDMIFEEALNAGLDYVVTTEKDAVRIDPGTKFPLPLYYLRLEIEILRGAADFNEAVDRICFPENRPAGEMVTAP
jgi:tetraacyldisaccharide 4'-kinase